MFLLYYSEYRIHRFVNINKHANYNVEIYSYANPILQEVQELEGIVLTQ